MSVEMTRTDPHRDLDETGWGADTVRAVYDRLAGIANSRGIAEASHRDLAAALHMSVATARRAVDTLLEAGQVERLRVGTGGRYRSRYRVHAATPASPAA